MHTLLLVDDSTTIHRLIQLTFAGEDVTVVATSDGEEARHRIEANPPDIVLADVGMPKVSGYEVAAHVKRSPALKHIPVLLLTGAFEPIDEDKARESGCDGILVKPIEPTQLVSRVKALLSKPRTPAPWPQALPPVEPPRPESPRVEMTSPLEIPVVDPPPAPLMVDDLPLVVTPVPPLVVTRFEPPTPTPPAPEPVTLAPAPVPAPAAPVPIVHEDDWEFQQGMDELDAAFAVLDSGAGGLGAGVTSDFAKDLTTHREGLGQWDIPAPPAQPEAAQPAAFVPPAASMFPERTTDAPPPAPPVGPTHEPGDLVADERGNLSRVSIAGAFSALLAAEQAVPAKPTRQAPATSDSAMEELVKRALSKMTDQAVRQIVLETAERLIREEIARIREIQRTGIDEP